MTRVLMKQRLLSLSKLPGFACILSGVIHHTPAIPDDPEIPHLFITNHKDDI